MWTVKKIDEVHSKGGKIREFYSYCGGLPAPECADNPLGFKISWSPRGALLSQRNSATFLQNGKVVEISSNDLMRTSKPYYVMDGYDFVAYPNRSSVPFRIFTKFPKHILSSEVHLGTKEIQRSYKPWPTWDGWIRTRRTG